MRFFKFHQLLFFITLYSCSSSHPSEKTTDQTYAALIDGTPVYVEEVDSSISFQIYQMRKQATQMLVGEKLLLRESKRQKISQEELIETKIKKHCDTITDNKENAICVQKRQFAFTDSLKDIYKTKTVIEPPFFSMAETAPSNSFSLNSSNGEIDVYIISDFNCCACKNIKPLLEDLYIKYDDEVNFKFIYFSSYIDNSALACKSAEDQGKFKEMHDKIFDHPGSINNDSTYFTFAEDLHMDISSFTKTMKDKSLLKPFLKTQEYLAQNKIYSTPSFIVNGKILNESHSIHYLENIIKKELK